MTKLQSAVWLHPIAGELLDGGWAEGMVRTTYNGEPVQIRIDYFNPNYRDELTGREGAIIDIKTYESIDFFEADARRYGYLHQLAFYREVMRIASGEKFPVYIIAVEKKAPYRVGVWKLAPEALDDAKADNERAISLLRESTARTAGRPATRRCASSTSIAETHPTNTTERYRHVVYQFNHERPRGAAAPHHDLRLGGHREEHVRCAGSEPRVRPDGGRAFGDRLLEVPAGEELRRRRSPASGGARRAARLRHGCHRFARLA